MEHQTGPDETGGADSAPPAAILVPRSAPGATAEAPEPGDMGDESVGAGTGGAGTGGADTGGADTGGADAGGADAVPPTGEPRVDAALKLLDRLPGLAVSEHPDLFEQVHAQLSDVLGELDSGPAGTASG
jgi:hypothetical protein